ncbi:unnamed protein product [Plutella xylostella]|uniref:acid phosphatase n=1 Tax=Plutella xylostella TaxID=51655 RepID=A0A8S4DHK9_PLUXY|nr:unnamed protein product [Plutella xylostella]
MAIWWFMSCLVALAAGDNTGVMVEQPNNVETSGDCLNETDLWSVFAIFRHGDRTPDQEELDLFPDADIHDKDVFFPHGKKALTNKGKQRGFLVGRSLRERYDNFISSLYLPAEVTVRTTDYARTKMTALTAMAALFPPPPAQRWNPALDWQPVPYDTLPFDEDDLLYWYNCPSYLQARDEVYTRPEVRAETAQYQDLFEYLTRQTGTNISTTEDVFFLDNLFQTLNNVGIKTPQWAQEVMPRIKQVTKLEYGYEFYTDELTRLATGVLMADIINSMHLAIAGDTEQPKLTLYSAHENNVAALLAAARVFTPHQPHYGSTFAIELRRNKNSGEFVVAAIYSPDAGGSGQALPIQGCGGRLLCDYETFVTLTQNLVWTHEEYRAHCNIS